jgi:hypothetical protein
MIARMRKFDQKHFDDGAWSGSGSAPEYRKRFDVLMTVSFERTVC